MRDGIEVEIELDEMLESELYYKDESESKVNIEHIQMMIIQSKNDPLQIEQSLLNSITQDFITYLFTPSPQVNDTNFKKQLLEFKEQLIQAYCGGGHLRETRVPVD